MDSSLSEDVAGVVAGAPGLGPITLQREAVVFKNSGFRSRHYCLSECTQVCYASINGPAPAVSAGQ